MKRANYGVIYDKQFENGFVDVQKVIVLKNLGDKTGLRLHSQLGCIMSVAAEIDEAYGLYYSEIVEVLEKIYGYQVIDKEDMIEPFRYMTLDTYYSWELYAQNEEWAKVCNEQVKDGLKELLSEIISRPYINE